MAELALRTSEFYNAKDKYIAWRPRGSVIVAISNWQMRRKWLEICCELVSTDIIKKGPNAGKMKRDLYQNIPGWQALCDAWEPQMQATWLDWGKPTAEYPHGRLLQDRTAAQELWDSLIVPTGVVSALPTAPEATVKVCDTWLWSEQERKDFYITVNTDEDDATAEGWGRQKERLLFKLALPSIPYVLEVEDPLPADTYRVLAPAKVIDYETTLGLDAGMLADIADPEKIVHPDFTHTVPKLNVLDVDITATPMPKK